MIKAMYTWYVYGDNGAGPLSLRKIALKLNGMGEKTPHNRKNVARQWVPSTVLRILLNGIYSGCANYGKQKVFDGKRENQPRADWIQIQVPELAIVERETFEAVRARAQRNIELSRRHQKHEYLLSGFLRCGACESAMAGMGSDKHPPVYHCGNPYRAAGKCTQAGMSVSARVLETLAWEWLTGLLEDEKKLDKGLRAMEREAKEEIAPKQERLEQIARLLAEAEAGVKRLVGSIGDETDEAIAAALKNELKNRGRQIESYKREAQTLEASLSEKSFTPERRDRIKKQAAEVRRRLANPTFAQKRSVLDAVNFRASFRRDADGKRWLDVKCGLSPEGKPIELQPS